MKCESSDMGKVCGKVARFKIVDFECGNEDGDYVMFWVCDKCIKYFISKNEDNPHYILLEERRKKNES